LLLSLIRISLPLPFIILFLIVLFTIIILIILWLWLLSLRGCVGLGLRSLGFLLKILLKMIDYLVLLSGLGVKRHLLCLWSIPTAFHLSFLAGVIVDIFVKSLFVILIIVHF